MDRKKLDDKMFMKSCLARPLLSLWIVITLKSPHIHTHFFSRCNMPITRANRSLKCCNDINGGLYTQPQIKLHFVFIEFSKILMNTELQSPPSWSSFRALYCKDLWIYTLIYIYPFSLLYDSFLYCSSAFYI